MSLPQGTGLRIFPLLSRDGRLPRTPVCPGQPSLRQVLISSPGKPGPPFGVPDPPTASITATAASPESGGARDQLVSLGPFIPALLQNQGPRTQRRSGTTEVNARGLLIVTLVLLRRGLTGPSWRFGDRGSAGLHELPVMPSAQGL